MDYKQILEDVLEIEESGIVVISGYGDLILDEGNNQYPNPTFKFKGLTEEDFWIKIGRADNSQVLEALLECNEHQLDNDSLEGEYSFDMIFRWSPAEYHEYHLISPGYLDLRYTNWRFIQTFQQRERERILNQVFDDNNIFDI
jgi:hypothetical protein